MNWQSPDLLMGIGFAGMLITHLAAYGLGLPDWFIWLDRVILFLMIVIRGLLR